LKIYIFSIEEPIMKAIEKISKAATKPVTTINNNTIQFAAKKFWLPLVFGASLIYMGNPPHAGEQQGAGNQPMQSGSRQGQAGKWGMAQGTESQGSGRGTKPAPGYTDDRVRNQGSNTLERGGNRIRQGTDRPGSDPMDRDTTPSGERGISPDIDKGTTPDSENINKDTTGPGGDNMMRDAIPGGSGIKRE
jgi:hypothetical protein